MVCTWDEMMDINYSTLPFNALCPNINVLKKSMCEPWFSQSFLMPVGSMFSRFWICRAVWQIQFIQTWNPKDRKFITHRFAFPQSLSHFYKCAKLDSNRKILNGKRRADIHTKQEDNYCQNKIENRKPFGGEGDRISSWIHYQGLSEVLLARQTWTFAPDTMWLPQQTEDCMKLQCRNFQAN